MNLPKPVSISLVAIVVAAMVIIFALPNINFSQTSSAERQDISVQDLAGLDDAFVLDVRQDWEYAEGHVPGALLIPLDQLKTRLDELPRDQAIHIICRSGNRSVNASSILLDGGFKDVRNVLGGTLAWIEAGYEVEQ